MAEGTEPNPMEPFPNLTYGVSDLNTLYQTRPDIKIVRIAYETQNAPSTNFSGFCIHCGASENWQTQIAMQVGNDTIYRRIHNSSGWSSWRAT